jgi:hypothetical protein
VTVIVQAMRVALLPHCAGISVSSARLQTAIQTVCMMFVHSLYDVSRVCQATAAMSRRASSTTIAGAVGGVRDMASELALASFAYDRVAAVQALAIAVPRVGALPASVLPVAVVHASPTSALVSHLMAAVRAVANVKRAADLDGVLGVLWCVV